MTSNRNINRYKYRKHLINRKVLNQIIKDSPLCKHAIKELQLAGYKNNNYCPSGWMFNQVLEALAVFVSHGNSGFSAPLEINLVKKLSIFDVITPLKFDNTEWKWCYDDVYQNIRKSSIFKHGGKINDVDTFVKTPIKRYSYNTKEWRKVEPISYHGGLFEHKNGVLTGRYFNRCYIKYDPTKGYIPKETINIPCLEVEFAKDDWIMAVDADDKDLAKLNEEYDIEWKLSPTAKDIRLEDYNSGIDNLVFEDLNRNK
jgi:hypothetical protein|nr:MAG TPA: hypothetical protein [Crassvirales sp.]